MNRKESIRDSEVTTAKLSFVPSAFVPRAVGAADKTIADFIFNGNPYPDGLDLSGIVPIGAKAVVLGIAAYSTAADKVARIQRDFIVYPYGNRAYLYSVVAAKYIIVTHVLPCDADRLFDYSGAPEYTQFDVTVEGWFI